MPVDPSRSERYRRSRSLAVTALRSVSAALLLAGAGPIFQAPATVVDCLSSSRAKARWKLPPAMREVSGLALTDDGRLLLHNDEQGVVMALDAATGRVVGNYQLGAIPPSGDFEGIAVAGRTLVLTTSDGVLYEMDLPLKATSGGILPFTVTATGVGARCEVEGLSYDRTDRVLLLACKKPRKKSLRKQVAVFRWDLAARAMARPDRVVFNEADLGNRQGQGFHPSAIEVDPRSGQWIMLASADKAVAAVDRSGRVIATAPLGRHHRQPEGLALGADGSVYVSDEGGHGAGTVTVYACR